ncbi:hypothetical protein P4H39_17370 [Paenibacillus lautus]|uniref:hypothetical protein n=1 Tax=Paenibacillus lautus TaxID=1401 RepID=UPI002DBB9EF9|nr:hypothetical protein [Paenibacillus lautus]MEC0204386.1 hypothetical protein [Paenibacillus lautus]
MRKSLDPTWARLGFSEAPDFMESPVHDDFSVTCQNIALEEPVENEDASGEHGLMTFPERAGNVISDALM